jgi:hypothetical protein
VLVAVLVAGTLLYLWLSHGANPGPEPAIPGVTPSSSVSQALSSSR